MFLRVRVQWLLALVAGMAFAAARAADDPAGNAAVTGAALWPPPDVRTEWVSPGFRPGSTTHLKLLAFNDFHGNLSSPSVASARPVGSAAVLAAYLEAAERAAPGHTLIVHAGDHVGASPPLARLLHNEPSIDFLNLLADEHCAPGMALRFFDAQSWQRSPDRCNVIGTLGNHEFDRGPAEIRRLLDGGEVAGAPTLDHPYRGSRVPYVCANVQERRTGKLILPPYAVVDVGGIPVGVIGAVLRGTNETVPAWAIEDVEFLDEADSINHAARELERRGIHTIIVTIHQGLAPESAPDGIHYHGPLTEIVARLDPDIDVVVSGHTHNYTNTLLPSRDGHPILVTQAYAFGVAYADIDLEVDRKSRDVMRKSALIVPTWADAGPGLHPDARVERLTAAAKQLVDPLVASVVGRTARAITRTPTSAGESALGNLVADAQRAATHADIALMNPGGLRADLPAGRITRADVLTLHPFENRLVTLELSGAQILHVLEQQWPSRRDALPRVLKTSGLYYAWDSTRPAGAHVAAACDAQHHPLEAARRYRVTVNDFLAGGGDGFSSLKEAGTGQLGPLDAEALEQYFRAQSGPVDAHTEGRIVRADGAPSAGCAL
jgi:5'-nucleotidase